MELPDAAASVLRLAATAAVVVAYAALMVLGARRSRAWQRAPAPVQPQAIAVQVEGRPGAWVNLGTSLESPDVMSGAPRLKPMPFISHDAQGRVVMPAPGAALDIRSLAGARRTLLNSVTREDGGVDHRYSLEVPPGAKLWFLGLPRPVASESSPQMVDPVDGAVGVYGQPPPLDVKPRPGFFPGCLVMVAGIALCLMVASWLGWLGRIDGWWVALALAAMAFFADRTNLPPPPPEPSEASAADDLASAADAGPEVEQGAGPDEP